ncbi:MAG: hypothetical protein F6K31_22235 [Symploca sp. SIO2G7]|nr:hypothetical protein [Symploca sp. SIO2G7]
MGRAESLSSLKRRTTWAQNRLNYVPPDPEVNESPDPRPRSSFLYVSTSPIAPDGTQFTVSTSTNAVIFFGQNALGLADAALDPAPPRNFEPGMVIAKIGSSNPKRRKAKGSKRVYTDYSGSSDNGQGSFSAAFCAKTDNSLRTAYLALANSVKSKLNGSHGSISFKPEYYPVIISG